MENEGVSNSAIKCPTCQRDVLVPEGGSSGFPQNLHLGFEVKVAEYASKIAAFGSSDNELQCDRCIDASRGPAEVFCCTCCMFLCKPCHTYHKRGRQESKHSVVGLRKEGAAKELLASIEPQERLCSCHHLVLDVYCMTCKCLFCAKCILFDHKEHIWTDLLEVAMSDHNELYRLLDALKEAMTKLNEGIERSNDMIKKTEISKKNAQLAIDQTFDKLLQALQERKQALLEELEAVTLSRKTVLTLEKEKMEKVVKEINHYSAVASDILKTHTAQEMVTLGGVVHAELKSKVRIVDSYFTTPMEDNVISVSLQANELMMEVSKFGNIFEMSACASPSESTWTSLSTARMKKTLRIKVATNNSSGERYPCGGLKIKAELRAKSPVVTGEVEDHRDGTYTISLIPPCLGLTKSTSQWMTNTCRTVPST